MHLTCTFRRLSAPEAVCPAVPGVLVCRDGVAGVAAVPRQGRARRRHVQVHRAAVALLGVTAVTRI